MCVTYSSPFSPFKTKPVASARTEELPLQSMATHWRSSSLPDMDVAGGERTGGAPPLAAMARGARRDKETGREGAERCS